jgi:hypothetical protein
VWGTYSIDVKNIYVEKGRLRQPFAVADSDPMFSRKSGRKELDMPRGDGSGPQGFGPLTGRRAGFCAGYNMPGYANNVGGGFGRGRGFGGGMGMGFRRGRGGGGGWGYPGGFPGAYPPAYPVAPPAVQAPDAGQLKGQIDVLEQTLADLKAKLNDLEQGSKE